MKSVARNHVWWKNIDEDLDSLVKSCGGCARNKSSSTEAPIHPWEFPKKPWSRVHIDFAGPFQGHMYFVAVDAYSKWPVVKIMHKTTATHTVEVLRAIFANCGICDEIVCDNGPQFVSDEFRSFLVKNCVKVRYSAPYHPKTNGLAERFVQSMKQALRAAKNDQGTVQTKLSRFLLAYRNAEHQTTRTSPASLFYGRNLSTRLDKMKPSLEKRVESQQSAMRRSTRDRNFDIGDNVTVRDYKKDQDKWIPGTISSRTGPVSYRVEIAPGVTWRRHADQIRSSNLGLSSDHSVSDSSVVKASIFENDNKPVSEQSSSSQSSSSLSSCSQSSSSQSSCSQSSSSQSSCTQSSSSETSVSDKRTSVVEVPKSEDITISEKRYPTRNRKKVEKLNL
ncbi:uncharacterized protein K02A2.6-like [Mercenaria mercenaria]|uniref:uncharacterized protein K02A2.6-like n=1 Tax=Mercenaria mercenaria TaxID=6596 RepID=UPI00234E699C|nr:uncharacterized protein K02A2.6-like [Mercenaria mercenaria]